MRRSLSPPGTPPGAPPGQPPFAKVGWFRECRWLGESTERGMDLSPARCRSFSREAAGRGSRGGGASPREDMSEGRRTGPAARRSPLIDREVMSRRGSTHRGVTGRQRRREAGKLAPPGVSSAGGASLGPLWTLRFPHFVFRRPVHWPPTPSRPGALSTADFENWTERESLTLGTESCGSVCRDFAGEAPTKH